MVIRRYLNIYEESKFKKWENEDDLDTFLNGPNFTGIILMG